MVCKFEELGVGAPYIAKLCSTEFGKISLFPAKYKLVLGSGKIAMDRTHMNIKSQDWIFASRSFQCGDLSL
jgi:hypothetical protein